jgi:hypothetical protein
VELAERLVIGPKCTELGGFFAPLMKKVHVLDLRQAPAKFRASRFVFSGIIFDEIRPAKPEICVPFADAFDDASAPFCVTAKPGEDFKKTKLGPRIRSRRSSGRTFRIFASSTSRRRAGRPSPTTGSTAAAGSRR